METTEHAQPQGESISKKEQELIAQLVSIRKEQKQDLPFENLDGYEVPPRLLSSSQKTRAYFQALKNGVQLRCRSSV